MTDQELLDLVERYRASHNGTFHEAEVLAWAIREAIVPPMTKLEFSLTVEQMGEALERATERLPDGRQRSVYLKIPRGKKDRALEDEFKALTEKPPSEMTREEFEARLRADCQSIVDDCDRLLADADHIAQLHPDWKPNPGLEEIRRHRDEALCALAELETGR
jgi:hypothetical protein